MQADRVKLLPEKVANQIAAGEVVIRPCSVVKEMMENAIDAGATEVTVNFREGGFELIQIIDNGCGMSSNDARMAFDRHATSKISTVEDIYALRTFGFRGEALASIGAVAKVELKTRQEGANMGTITQVQGGDFISQQPTICDAGSQFMVRELFYNIPVRRKFADKPTTSANQIKTEFKRVALCYPDIRFELYGNDSPIYSLAPATLAGRIVDIVGKPIKQKLLEISTDTSIVKIKGYIGHPSSAKRSCSDQYLFVNGRFFRSAYFAKAILRGYDKLIMEGLNPPFFIFLDIDPERVDVNVHPQKTEVKFADEESIWQILNAATRESLAVSGAVPMMEFDDITPIDIPIASKGVSYAEPRVSSLANYNPFDEEYINPQASDVTESFTGFDFIPTQSEPEQMTFDIIESEGINFINPAPIGGGYIAAILSGDVVIVDSQRARERILFDHYMGCLSSGGSISQQLLFEQKLSLSMGDYELMESAAMEFTLLGFDIEYCGGGDILVRGVPADESAESVDRVIYDLIQLLGSPIDMEEHRREKIAMTMAQAGSQTGAILSDEEAQEILTRLSQTSNISFAPSGKDIFWRVTKQEIKNRLG